LDHFSFLKVQFLLKFHLTTPNIVAILNLNNRYSFGKKEKQGKDFVTCPANMLTRCFIGKQSICRKQFQNPKFQQWRGLDRISIIVHEMKCIFREIIKDDFGMDGEIELVVPKPDGKGYPNDRKHYQGASKVWNELRETG
jgi:hypothetical protein